jgi:hypothetical protein
MKLKNSFIAVMMLIAVSCTREKDNSSSDEKQPIVEKCPCDSSGSYKEKGRDVKFYYLGKSLIEMKYSPNNDTVDVKRLYTTDSIWHIQEYMITSKGLMVDSIFAIYCDLKDTAEFYKLTYIMNEKLERFPGLVINGTVGVDGVINDADTIRSKNSSVLIPKERFKGKVELIKTLSTTIKGKTSNRQFSITVEAASMLKYGILLEQYKAINRLCNKNKAAVN